MKDNLEVFDLIFEHLSHLLCIKKKSSLTFIFSEENSVNYIIQTMQKHVLFTLPKLVNCI